MSDFKGLAYPIVPTPKGYFPVSTGVDLIKGDLLSLLLTNPGERILNPEFGTPLRDLLFEPNDALLAERARNMIIESIARWEPRIKIQAIDIYPGVENSFLHPEDDFAQKDNILGIRIMFIDPQDIQEVQELVLQVPLQTGNIQ